MVQEHNDLNITGHGLQGEVVKTDIQNSASSVSPSDTSINSVSVGETTINNDSLPDFISSGQMHTLIGGKTSENALLDERSLLACIVRTIPPGGRIRISTTVSEF